MEAKVAIIIGSDSDLPVIKPALDMLDKLGIGYLLHISSAHRTPDLTVQIVRDAEKDGVKVIIAAAGGAAHLPGVVAAMTTLPVIGLPVKSDALAGVDSLYSIVQMPSGIPVATVAINGAKNAAILAAQILGTADEAISDKLRVFKQEMAKEVAAKDARLQEIGAAAYLNK